jgi:hypothetical protein
MQRRKRIWLRKDAEKKENMDERNEWRLFLERLRAIVGV